MRRHAVRAHEMYFRPLAGAPTLVPIPPGELAVARARVIINDARAADRPRLRQQLLSAAAPAAQPRTGVRRPASPSSPVRATSPPGSPAAEIRRSSSAPAAASAVPADLDLDFTLDDILSELPELSGAEFAVPAPTAAFNPAPPGPAAMQLDVVTELPPTWLPPGLLTADLVAFIVDNPTLSAYDVVSVLVGRLGGAPASPAQYDSLRQAVTVAVLVERRIYAAAAQAAELASAAGADPIATLTAALGRLYLAASRPQ